VTHEPNGPLTPDERDRARDLLSAQQFVVYKNDREGMTVTMNASRAGVTRKRIRNIVREAQLALGYEPTYAPKQSQPGKYKSVAEQQEELRDERTVEFKRLLAALNDANAAELTMLFGNQPVKAREEMDARLAGVSNDVEKLAIYAEYLSGPALERLRKLGGEVQLPGDRDFLNRVRKFDSCRGHTAWLVRKPQRAALSEVSSPTTSSAQVRLGPPGRGEDWRKTGATTCRVMGHSERPN
jgi:hypothetical protein